MELDLSQFDGMKPGRIVRALKDMGYAEIGSGHDCVVLALPDDNNVVRLSYFAQQAGSFAALCNEYEANPHFPLVHGMRLVGDNPVAALMVMERLQGLDELPEGVRSVMGGSARALALLITGHASHDDVHAYMLRNRDVADAALAIVDTLQNYLERGREEFLYYDREYAEGGETALEDWVPENIMFRPRVQGGWDLVFIDPLREGGPVRDEAHRDELRQEIATLRERLTGLARDDKRPDLSFAPQPPRGPL